MVAALKQRNIERAFRAAAKAGLSPTSADCHPDGKLVLCFGESKVSAEDSLDREMAKWRAGSSRPS